MAKIQYGPVNKFPGLSNDEIDRLEKYTANLTGAAKIQEQHKLYEEVMGYKQKQAYSDNRTAAINEMSYRGIQSNDQSERKKSSTLSRQEILADMAKEKYNLPYDTDTNTILQGVIKDAQMKGVSPDLLKKYINNGDESFLYEMGYKEESTLKNIGQGIYDSLGGITSTIDRYIATPLAAGIAKLAGVDSEKVDQEKAKIIDQIENKEPTNIGGNRESTAYTVSNVATDLAQLVGGEEAAIKALTGIPKVTKLISTANKLGDAVDQFPILGKLTTFTTKKSAQGVTDTILYNAINGEGTDLGEMGEGAAINTALGGLGKFVPTKKGVEEFAKKLEVQGLVNGKILETVNAELRKAGSDELQGVKSAGNWLLTRKIKGSGNEIAEKLGEHAETFSKAKNELLDLSQTFKESEYTRNAIDFLKKEYDSSILTKDVKAKIEGLKMLDGKTTFRAKEIQQIEDAFDAVANIYKKSTEKKAGIDNMALDEIRRGMKKDIEDIIEKDGLGNMKAINNEIQVAKTLQEGVMGKLYNEEAQSIVPKSYSSFFGSILETAGVPRAMRGLANILTKFSGMDKKTIAKRLDEVGNFDEEFLKKVIPENKREAFMESFNDLIGKGDTTLATTNKLSVPKARQPKEPVTPKKKKDLNIKSTIRKYLLTQAEEGLDED